MPHSALAGPDAPAIASLPRVPAVRTGLDVLVRDGHPRLRGRRVGLLVNQASVDGTCRHATDRLFGRDDFTIGAVFGPQHGLWGTTQDNMIEWEGGADPRLGVPVHSLYGQVRRPTREMLAGLEAMVVDLFDVGSRYYTFVWTATLVMEACAERGIPVVVLDRPNPINGIDVEGPPLDPAHASFVGRFDLPVRHGLTMGEMLRMLNETVPLGCDLTVVPMEGWRRSMWFDDTGLPWAMPSPNMPTLDTAVVYPGMCLFEGTQLSEGRGTTRPFEICGMPGIDAHALVDALAEDDLPGCFMRPLYFEPTFQKCARETCGGVFMHVTDRARFRSIRTAVALLARMRALSGGRFAWKAPPYEYEAIKMPIDILWGGPGLREHVEAGGTADALARTWAPNEDAFREARRPWLMYVD